MSISNKIQEDKLNANGTVDDGDDDGNDIYIYIYIYIYI